MMLLRTEAADEACEIAGALFDVAVTCPEVDCEEVPDRGAPTDGRPAVDEATGKLIPMLLARESIDEICGSADALAGRSAMMLLRTEAADETCETAGPVPGIVVSNWVDDPDTASDEIPDTDASTDREMPVGAATDELAGSCGMIELTTPRRDERAGSLMALDEAEPRELM